MNMIGLRFGRLTVKRREGSNRQGMITWFCECDCGGTVVQAGAYLRNGNTQSCGCLRLDRLRAKVTKEEVGNRYGRLVVERREGSTDDGMARWLCRCDCGGIVVQAGAYLRNGNTQSCGCLMRERQRISSNANWEDPNYQAIRRQPNPINAAELRRQHHENGPVRLGQTAFWRRVKGIGHVELTADEVRSIRNDPRDGTVLGRIYNRHRTVINKIKKRQLHGHVSDL